MMGVGRAYSGTGVYAKVILVYIVVRENLHLFPWDFLLE